MQAQVLVSASVTLPSLRPKECQAGAASCAPATGTAAAFFYSTLYLMALGAGGVKACVYPFAGDQFDVTDPREARRRLSCPNGWFVTITSGNVMAMSFLVYTQGSLGWSWGYGVPAAVTAIWTVVYFCGVPLYRHQVIPAPGHGRQLPHAPRASASLLCSQLAGDGPRGPRSAPRSERRRQLSLSHSYLLGRPLSPPFPVSTSFILTYVHEMSFLY